MTKEEIRCQIQKLQEKQRQILTESVFILNGEYTKVKEEIEALQAQCDHEFENGTCKYCYKGEAR